MCALAVRKIPIEEALGLEIAHDITQIDPEKGIKGARFRKGHIVTEEDISVLKSMGKRHLYIIGLTEKEIHEDEAALLMSQKLRGNNVEAAGPEEGKISLKASCDGLVVYDEEMVHSVNSCEDMLLSCLPPYSRVTKGKDVASFRIIPLIMGRSQFNAVTSSMSHIHVRPFHPLRTALISTGSEVKEGLIRDQSLEKISPRVEALGGEVYIYRISGDGAAKVAAEIKDVLLEGAELVICTGGMSVDADDTTREGIESLLASRVLFRRVPTLPGCNLELVLVGSVPVIGVPAGVLYFDWTTLDLILPMVFAGVYPDREMVSRWGTRGLGCRVLPREV